MSGSLCVADASALYEMCRQIAEPKHPEFLEGLNRAMKKGCLGFPREVADDLSVIARDEPIWAWASGQRGRLDDFAGDIGQMRPLMGLVRDLGFPNGIESLDGRENCLSSIGCLCLHLEEQGKKFVVATEDFGEAPLRPTMEQIANRKGWTVISATETLGVLNLRHLLSD